MNTHINKNILSAITVTSIISFVIIFCVTKGGDSYTSQKIFSNLSTTITINAAMWSLFFKWGWKCRLFYPWLVPFPNLSGKWVATIKPNSEAARTKLIQSEVTIIQTYLNIQVLIKTDESRSYSRSASFKIDTNEEIRQLIYTYQNTPGANVRERSEIHYGTAMLDFEGTNKVEELCGEYWTSRKTTGEIVLIRKK